MTGNEQLVHYMAMNQDGVFFRQLHVFKAKGFFLRARVTDSALFLGHI